MTISDRNREQTILRKCKYCQSENVIKYGHYRGMQRYYCMNCRRKFVSYTSMIGMWYAERHLADAVYMYYNGMSLAAIHKILSEKYNIYVSKSSIYHWVQKGTQQTKKDMEKYHPSVNDVWVFIESTTMLNGKDYFIWDIIDISTAYLLASQLFEVRTPTNAQLLLEIASKCAGKYPKIVYTDNLTAYLEGIPNPSDMEAEHFQLLRFELKSLLGFVERFQSHVNNRSKKMRHLKTVKGARLFLDGWRDHYNFQIPNNVSGIKLPYKIIANL